MTAIRIACGPSHCSIFPQSGGSIGSWSVDGQAMLRDGQNCDSPLGSASFPLVPYSNRIAGAHFDWLGTPIGLTPHPLATPHALHGVGWENIWDISEVGNDYAHLRLFHQPNAHWPWPFEAVQEIRVGKDWLHIALSVCNLSEQAVPLAFGHHPYFDSEGANLSFSADRFYPAGADSLPMAAVEIDAANDFTNGKRVADGNFDNLFGGWNGLARIVWSGRKYQLTIEADAPHAVLYTPPGARYYCFEPVPHISNALNRADGDMPIIAPHDAYKTHIRFTAIAS